MTRLGSQRHRKEIDKLVNITCSKLFLECVVFCNLHQSGFYYSVNRHHILTAVLGEANLKAGTDPFPETWYVKF